MSSFDSITDSYVKNFGEKKGISEESARKILQSMQSTTILHPLDPVIFRNIERAPMHYVGAKIFP